jgi:hypothetical protein
MKNIRFIYVVILTCFLAGSLAGCGSSGSGGGPSTGILNLSITDAPVDDASSVIVEFTGVIIQPASGDRLEFDFMECSETGTSCVVDADCAGETNVCNDSHRQIDLLALNGGGSETILDGVTVPAGHYSWIRLKVNAECNIEDSYIEIPDDIDSPYSLWIPSGSETGLKLVQGFDVPAGGTASFTIDFNLRKSVNNPEGQGNCSGNYKLKPALRLVDNTDVGSISGTVSSELIDHESCTDGNVVYVFEDHGITPDDIDAIPPDPITTAMVKLDNSDYVYRASFLNEGDYTIAFTCQANGDNPVLNDTIAFVGTEEVSVTAGVVTIHNFQ